METCPKNIKYLISSYLNYFELRNFLQTCKSMAKLCQDEDFWHYLGFINCDCQTLDRMKYCTLIREKFVRDLIVKYGAEADTTAKFSILIHNNILGIALDRKYFTHMMFFSVRNFEGIVLNLYTQNIGVIKLDQFNSIIVCDSDNDEFYRINTMTAVTSKIQIENRNKVVCRSDIVHFLSHKNRIVRNNEVRYNHETICVKYDLLADKITCFENRFGL